MSIQLEQTTVTEESTGKYRSLGRIAVEEGGGPQGILNAHNYAMSCVEMGGHWTKYDKFTKALKF
eukprot:2401977-Karenia_brevis.AAC.1